MKKYTLSLLGFLIAATIFVATLLSGVDLFEQILVRLHSLEHFELDELILPLLVFLIFVIADFLHRQKTQKIEAEKIKIYKAMLSSTHHVLNNFLNQMQIFKVEAEQSAGFDSEILDYYKKIIADTSLQLDALGSITDINEQSIHASVSP